MITVTNNDIKITRGDTGTFKLTVYDLNETVYDISADEVLFTVKRNCVTKEILFGKRITVDGIVKINPEDTALLDYGFYYYDIQVKKPNGDTYTVIEPHYFEIKKEVTF